MSDSARYDSSSWTSADKQGDASKAGCSSSADANATVLGFDKRLKTMQKELNYSLRRIGEKESEKFDLIFAILSELQNRQGKLEEAVRSFKAQQGGGGGAGFSGDEGGQKNGAMNGGMCIANGQNGAMNGQNGCAPMNMQMVQCMPQVVVMSPTGCMNGAMNGGGMQPMQYAMVSPNGAAQPMPGQMMQMMQMPGQMSAPSGGMCNENGELMQQLQQQLQPEQQQPQQQLQQQQQQLQPQAEQQQQQQPPAEQQQQQPQASSQPEAPASSES